MAGGRPTKYSKEYPQRVYDMCIMGATDMDLAHEFGVEEKTINNWKIAHPEFLQALKEGKRIADEKVAKSLYNRAVGYDDPMAVKIFMPAGAEEPVYAPYVKHYPPDVTAQIFWLKNRDQSRWRDRHNLEHTGEDGGPIPVRIIDDIS